MAVAVALRVGYLAHQNQLQIKAVYGDTYIYETLAKNLVAGKGYVVNGLLNRPAVGPTAFYGPTYPMILAGSYTVFGVHRLPVQLIQLLLSVLTVLLVYLVGKDLFGKTSGLVAAALVAVYPDLVGYSGALLSETVYLFLQMLFVYLMVAAVRERRPPALVLFLAGLVFGVAYLCRQAITLAPVMMLPVFLWKYRSAGLKHLTGALVVFAAGACFLIGPWTVRNYIVFHKIYPSTTTGSVTFWWGNKGDWSGDMAAAVEAVKRAHPGYDEMRFDSLFYRLSLKDIETMGPVGYAKLCAKKWYRMWRPNYYFATSMRSPLLIGQMIFLYALIGTGIAGMIRYARRTPAVWAITAVFFTGLVINVLSLAIKRYTLPYLPLLAITAAPLWVTAAVSLKKRFGEHPAGDALS